MAANPRNCPACGAELLTEADPFPCPFCNWAPAEGEFPTADLHIESRHNAETLPLPKEQAAALGLEVELEPSDEPEPGPATLRRLTEASQGPPDRDELLEQVPEEMRGVLAARMQAADEAREKGFGQDTIASLKNRGYQVTEDARGARITGGSSRSPDLSPHEMVRMAAEQEGGVQPQGKLPICPECKAASPVGATRCQWCGAELPQE